MYDKSGFLKFAKDWKTYESRRFFTSDGASAYERAKKTYEDMLSELDDDGTYHLTHNVSVIPDYFPILTDSLDDGLIYEMGFTLVRGESEIGRISEYKVERPNIITLNVPGIKVVTRIPGLFVSKGRL